MELFPAIDIRGGHVVRLLRGDYQQETRYEMTPLAAAREFAAQGAKNLHVVDLDGAKDGQPANFDAIAEIAAQTGLFLEVGGGVRDAARLRDYLAAGAGRVILGTAAASNETLTANCVLAEDVTVGTANDETAVAYRTGHFNSNALIMDAEHTFSAADKEALRGVGILISDAVEI